MQITAEKLEHLVSATLQSLGSNANAPALILNDRAETRVAIANQPTFHRALADPA